MYNNINMEIKRAIEFGDDIRERLSDVYVNAFYDDVLLTGFCLNIFM